MLSLCYSKPGRPGRILTLDAAPRHAGDDLLSEDQEENQHGYNDDRSAGHLQIHLGAHRIPEVEQTDGHNPVGIALGDHKGPDKGIPLADKGQNSNGSNGILVHGDHDFPEVAPVAAAVHLGRFVEDGGDLHKILPHHIDIETAGHRWQNNALKGVHPAQLGDRDEVLDDEQLCGDHHSGQAKQKQQLFAPKFVNGEAVGRQHGKHQGKEGTAARHNNGVAQIKAKGGDGKSLRVIFKLGHRREQGWRDGDGLRQCFQGGKEHPQKREDHDKGSNSQNGDLDRLAHVLFHIRPSLIHSIQTAWRPTSESPSGPVRWPER